MPDTAPLTAAELHALVNGPFTMADGTTRRALWTRVPETQVIWFHAGGVSGGHFVSKVVRDRWDEKVEVPVEFAAALIRLAIEDWMLSDDYNKQLTIYWNDDDGERVYVVSDPIDGGVKPIGWGTTPLHALVHAAHVRADALGVER